MGTHSPFGEESHTTAHTAKRGPSLPRPQHGLVPSAKFLLVLHAFIYIHFPVHCEPSTPAEEKNPAKLPPQRCSKPLFIAFFNFSHKRPTLAFTAESGYTLAFANRIAHSGLHGETGVFGMGALLLPSERFARFGNPAWPGGRTTNFAAFGSWPGVRQKDAESLRDSDALMRVAVPRRRGPAGLRDLFTFVEVAACTPCAQSFLCVRGRGGITTLGVLCVLLKRWTAACQKGSFAVF